MEDVEKKECNRIIPNINKLLYRARKRLEADEFKVDKVLEDINWSIVMLGHIEKIVQDNVYLDNKPWID